MVKQKIFNMSYYGDLQNTTDDGKMVISHQQIKGHHVNSVHQQMAEAFV